MENKTEEQMPVLETYLTKEPPTLWKWYFGWHPRIFITVPIFILFVFSGIWFIFTELQDVISFFRQTPVTWLTIFFVLILGSIFLTLLYLPIYICFRAIGWLYEINNENHTPWKKFLYSVGILLLVAIGATIIRDILAWIMGVL
jgi:hypothetical protein